MTGMDAWQLIAPAIANDLLKTEYGSEAYVILFASLQIYDGKHGMKSGSCDDCLYSGKQEDEFPCRCCKEAFASRFESRKDR